MVDRVVLAGLVAVVIGVSPARAQQPGSEGGDRRYSAGLVAGVSQFDLSGTGTDRIVGARVDVEMKRWLIAEGALGFFRPRESSGIHTYYIPEAQLQVQLPLPIARPYIGAGGGYFIGTGGRQTRGTASISGGLRVAIGDLPADARAELRVRGIGSSFGGATAEWTLGASYRF